MVKAGPKLRSRVEGEGSCPLLMYVAPFVSS